jgi:hypothetical protein
MNEAHEPQSWELLTPHPQSFQGWRAEKAMCDVSVELRRPEGNTPEMAVRRHF